MTPGEGLSSSNTRAAHTGRLSDASPYRQSPMTDHLAAFFSNEFPAEIRSEYRQLRAKCIPPDEAFEQLLYDKREAMIILPQEGALFWIALAAVAVDGRLEPRVLDALRAIPEVVDVRQAQLE